MNFRILHEQSSHILLQMHSDFQFYIIIHKFNARWHFTRKKEVYCALFNSGLPLHNGTRRKETIAWQLHHI